MTAETDLILGVEKKLWLATNTTPGEKPFEILKWTTTKPEHDNGYIEKGGVLVFNRLSPYRIKERQPLEFMIIRPGTVPGDYPVDFFEEEIDSLTKEGALELLSIEDIDEVSIILGKVLIKYPMRLSFDTKVISPGDLYIIFGPKEMNQSKGKITSGEKISLQHLIDVFSTAVGFNLIGK